MKNNLQILVTKLRQATAQLPYLPRALGLVWSAAPGHTLGWFGILLAQGLLPVAQVLLTKRLVDAVVRVAGMNISWQALNPLLVLAALMVLTMLSQELLESAANWVRAAQGELFQDYITARIHRQSINLDLAFYESSDYYDRLYRARSEAGYRPIALLENLGGLLQNGLTLIAMAAVLLPYGVWLPLALFLSTLPAFYVLLNYAVRQHDLRVRVTADERRAWYYDWLITAQETAAELRLFGLGGHFMAHYQALRQNLRKQRLALVRDEGLARLFAGFLALVITGAAIAWMGWRVLLGAVTLGDLALFYQAFSKGQGLMHSLLENFSQIYTNSLFLGDLFAFLSLQPQVQDPPAPREFPGSLKHGLGFREISFRYPGSARPALHDFSLEISAGQIAAIVGPNGAGKSTLIKLLCRYYDPEHGQIEMDGIDLRSLSLEELRRSITVLFQDPVHYQDTIAENIALGDRESNPDEQAIRQAARAAGADLFSERQPQGYQTMLGRWFAEGTELSTGEWQRIALARAFLRQAPIIILDEPTSAMDPWAEADWLDRFRQLAQGRTSVIITHRFTTAAHADIIHVMDEGRIIESGTHRQLLASQGRYAQSWSAQMRRWQVDPLPIKS